MTTALSFKDLVDVPRWRMAAPLPIATLAGAMFAADMRNDISCDPYIYYLTSTATFAAYNPYNDGWQIRPSMSLGVFGAGAGLVVHPSQGPRGTLAAGNGTQKVVLSTALPGAVGVNQLANNGRGVGYRIRIIDNGSGGTGKTGEATIVANTSGTTPTCLLDVTLGFTPVTGSAYELLSGKVYFYGSGITAGTWKSYDIATATVSAALTSPAAGSGVSCHLVALSELYVPSTQAPGTGFVGPITSTGIAAGTITGSVAGGDSALIANQYRNFQVRVIEDLTTVAAAGQRRKISSHTGGASPVYTLASNWTTTPTSGAKFVIENDDDKIILNHDANTNTYCYNIAANTWDTTTFAVQPAVNAAGCWAAQSFGISINTDNANDTARHSMIYRARGGTVATIDVFDIAAGATGVWSSAIVYANSGPQFGQGGHAAYDPVCNAGKYVYCTAGIATSPQNTYRLDLHNRHLEPWAYMPIPQGVAVTNGCMANAYFIDGATKISFTFNALNTLSTMLAVCNSR